MAAGDVKRTISIYIDATSALKQQATLEKQQNSLNKAIVAGTAAGKDMSGAFSQLDKVNAQMKTLQDQLSGKIDPSLRQVKQSASQAYNELARLSKGTSDYTAKKDEWDQLNQKVKDLKADINGVNSEMGKMSGGPLADIAKGAAGLFALDKIKDVAVDKVNENAKLSDSLTELQDITKMTDAEIVQFNADLKDVDTRTSTEGLQELANTVAQLGAKKADLESVTVAADKVTVALSGKIGDKNQFIKDITEQYRVFNNTQEITAEDILKVGNAYEVMGGQGAASATFIKGFTEKLEGFGAASNISLGDTIGFAGGLSDLGITSEGSSASLVKLLQQMGTDTPKYAKIAGEGVQEFADLLANKPLAALLAVSKGLTDSKTDLSALSEAFADSKDGGARVANTLMLIGKNTDFLQGKMQQAGEAINSTSEIEDAFDKKNNDLAANLAKIGKNIKEAFVNGAIVNGINTIVEKVGQFTGLLDDNSNNTKAWEDQKKYIADLSNSLDPLIDRVDALTGKTNLSATEQDELNTAIKTIAGTIPSAITQFDQYGNAIGISTSQARDFITMQKNLLPEMNREAINKEQDRLTGLQKDYDMYMAELQSMLANKDRDYRQYGEKAMGYYNKEIPRVQGLLNGLNKQILGAKALVSHLSGDDIKVPESKATGDDGDKTGTVVTPKDKGAEERQKEHDRVLAEIKQNHADVQALLADQAANDANAGTAKDNQEIQRVSDKYVKLLAAAKKFGIDSMQLTQDEQNELDALVKKQFSERSDSEYTQSLKALSDYFNQEKQKVQQDYTDQKINKTDFTAAMKGLDSQEAAGREKIAGDYSASSKKAAEDLEKDKTDRLTKGIADREQIEARSNQEKLAAAQLAVLTAKKGSDEQLTAQKSLLQQQFDIETEGLDKSSNVYKLKQQQLNDNLEKADKDSWQFRVQVAEQAVSSMMQAYSTYVNYLNSQDEAQIQSYTTQSDKKKQTLSDELAAKSISEDEYRIQTQAADTDLARKTATLKTKEFKRNQALSLLQAVVNGAEGITKIWSTYAAYPPIAAALTAVEAIAVGVQVGTIAAQKPPEASFGVGGILPGIGGLPNGPEHSQGGISLMNSQNGQKVGEIEGGEPILSTATYENNKPVVDALLHSSMKMGGRKIGPAWMYNSSSRLNVSGITRSIAATSSYSQPSASGNINYAQSDDGYGKFAEAVENLNKILSSGKIQTVMSMSNFDRIKKTWDGLKMGSSWKGNP